MKSISENNLDQLGKLCEKTLYREFQQGIEWLQPRVKQIEVMNIDKFDFDDKEIIDIQIVDYMTTFGAYLDRELNQTYNVQKTESRFKKRKNFTTYQFSNMESPEGIPTEMTMNIQFLVKVSTCLKLNLIDENGSMISE